MPSSSRRRHGRERGKGRKSGREKRNWADLPLDAISAILRKLDHVEILMGADQACRSWRSAARDDPSLWRRIDMCGHAELFYQVNLHGMAQAAVRCAMGQCEAFWGEYAGDDAFLLFLGEQAPSLKSLRLISCYDVSNEGFAEAIKKLRLLEELELSLTKNVFGQEVFETVGKSCPHLKRFRLSEHRFYSFEVVGYNKNGEAHPLFGKVVMWATQAAKMGIKWVVGDGKIVRFWEDQWIGTNLDRGEGAVEMDGKNAEKMETALRTRVGKQARRSD